jgi:hypothetical protein
MVLPKLGVRNIITAWPEDSRESAYGIIRVYGEPNEATQSMLIWYHNGPWKRTVVYRETVKHNFPLPHVECVEQVVNCLVPMEKACELVAFNGSISFNCTRGELSAFGHDEPSNLLSLNLAHDIIMDKKDFNKARRLYIESMVAYKQSKPVPYMEKLQFVQENDTTDLDEVAISDKDLTKSAARR